jgi:hypothetical protein
MDSLITAMTISATPTVRTFSIAVDKATMDALRYDRLLGMRFPVPKYVFLNRLVKRLADDIGLKIIEMERANG